VCSYSLSTASQGIGASGGVGSVGVTASPGCDWTAASNDAWLSVTTGASGNGNGTVGFLAAPNPGVSQRSGTLNIAGQTFTVTQAGTALNCTYTLGPTIQSIVPVGGGTGSVQLTTTPGCPWTSASNVSWILITGGAAGSGSGTVQYSVLANAGPQRAGSLTIAGQNFGITQSGDPSVRITDVRSITDFGNVPGFTSGSWLQITGVNLAPTTRIWQASDFNGDNAPVNLDGISVLFNGKFGFMYFTKPDDEFGPSQINVQAPGNLGDGPVNVQALNHFAVSNIFTMQKTALAPGMLAPPKFNIGGKQYLVATYGTNYFFVGNENLLPGAPFRPAKPGDILYVYGVGFGDTTPYFAPGVIPRVLTQLNAQAKFQFGPALVTPYYAGYYPNFIGLDLFGLVVPDVPDGDHQITVLVNGQPLAQTLYLTVKR
jgi:uncharacterized protein (TIGR03437 family)